MNRRIVDKWIEPAVNALKHTGIANSKDEIVKTFRAQISTFGAAMVMGNLRSAVAFFSKQGNSDVERDKLVRAIYYVIMGYDSKEQIDKVSALSIFEWICKNDNKETKEKFINASIALKLAMNFYTLVEKDNSQRGEKQ